MCAIFGIIGTYECEEAKKAFQTLIHRGVDASYTSVNDHCFLGMHRLAVTNVTKALTQIVNRKKKGFNYPYMEWLQESGELAVIERIQAKMNLFNESEVEMYLEKGRQGMFKQHLFSLYMLCK